MRVPHACFVVTALYQIIVVLGNPQAPEAAAQVPIGECVPYYDELVQANLQTFPTIWQTANIVPSDTEALSWWSAIQSGIPPIAVKGGGTGDITTALRSYPSSDPDCWWSYNQCVTSRYPGIPQDIVTVPEPRTLGYGFDDGPNCAHNTFYSYLSSQNQLATMYYIGSNVLNWPREARRAVQEGHEICLHGWSHKYMTSLSNEQVFAELYYARKAVRLVAGVTPNCWRPPFGDIDDRVRYIAYSLGLVAVLWEHDTYDWQAGQGSITVADIDENYQNIVSMAANGAFNQRGTIILMHELSNFTMLQAAKYYPSFRSVFNHILPVGVALNMTQFYAEPDRPELTFSQYTASHEAPLESREGDEKRAIIMNPFQQPSHYEQKGTNYPYIPKGSTQPYGPFFGTIPRLTSGARSLSKWDSRPDFVDAVWAMCVGFSVVLLVFRFV